MMRAVRFVSQLSFQIEPVTYEAIKKCAPLLEHISVERKYTEFSKLLSGPDKGNAIRQLVNRNIYLYLPGLADYERQLEQFADHIEKMDFTEIEKWSLLLILIEEEPVNRFLRAWKMSNQMIKQIKNIFIAYKKRKNSPWTKERVYYTGLETSISTEKIYSFLHGLDMRENIDRIEKMHQSLPIKDRSDLDVSGYDLMEWTGKKRAMVEKRIGGHRKGGY